MCDKEAFAKLRDQSAENSRQIAAISGGSDLDSSSRSFASRSAAAFATTNEVTVTVTP